VRVTRNRIPDVMETAMAQSRPIDFYYWNTPNGFKVSIMLEECGLPYTVHPVNISTGDQFKPEFLAISPNNKIPAIVDPEGPDGQPISVFESAAILEYLARKTGKFYVRGERALVELQQWLYFQMGTFGPMAGQAHHFRLFAPEKIPYAIERYTKECQRVYGVMDRRLVDRPYFTGDDYTIADIANMGWAMRHERHGIDLAEFPNVKRWYEALMARPAVQRGLALPAEPPAVAAR
jgi:GST-like protein